MKDFFKKHLPFLLVIVLSIIFVYWKLPGGFFEQDEWHTFSFYNYLLSLNPTDFWSNVVASGSLSHFTPFSLLLKLYLYKMWGLNAANYFLVSISGHVVVSLVFYFLLWRIFKNNIAAFVGTLFFALNQSHSQAVTWIGTFDGTQGSLLFGLVSFVFLTYFFEKRRYVFFALSGTAFLFALFFKETAIFFAPIFAILFYRKYKFGILRKELFFCAFLVVFYLSFRVLPVNNNTIPRESAVNVGSESRIGTLTYNLITVPVKAVVQDLIPNDYLLNQSVLKAPDFDRLTVKNFSPWRFPELLAYDSLTISAGVILLVALSIYFWKNKHSEGLLLSVLIVFFAVLPPLVVSRYYTNFDSRFLYPVSIGMGTFIAALYLGTNKKKLLLIPILVLVVAQSYFLTKSIQANIDQAKIRKNILSYIVETYPGLDKNTIFLVQSNKEYYYLPFKSLPFQSGFGNILLVEYGQREQIPNVFYKEFFLWDVESQGYEKHDGFGFGYYRDREVLESDMSKGLFTKADIITINWDGDRYAISSSSNK